MKEYDIVEDFPIEEIPKKKWYEINMSVKFDKEIDQEEAERRLARGLYNNGVVARKGGIH